MKLFVPRIRGHSKNVLLQNDIFLDPCPSNITLCIFFFKNPLLLFHSLNAKKKTNLSTNQKSDNNCFALRKLINAARIKLRFRRTSVLILLLEQWAQHFLFSFRYIYIYICIYIHICIYVYIFIYGCLNIKGQKQEFSAILVFTFTHRYICTNKPC